MKLVLFQKPPAGDVLPGLLTDRGVVSIADDVPSSSTPQLTMQGIIDRFDALRPALERRARGPDALPLSAVRLRPTPAAGKDPGLHRQLLGARRHGAESAEHVPQELRRGDRPR